MSHAPKTMKRRQFLKGAAVAGAAAGTSAIVTPAIAQSRIEWKMVTTWPKNFPGQGTGAVRFANSVEAATEGRLKINVYAAGELVPPFESFDAVTRGAADLMHATPYYWPNKSKALMFYSTVPFGMTTAEAEAWMQYGGGQDLWDKVLDPFGLKGYHAGSTGVQMGGWFNKEITSAASVNGMKMRIPGLGGEALKKLGLTVVNLPGGEIFAALQSGAIDATEWVGPWNDLTFGFFKVAKYYYWPGMHEPGTQIEVTVDKKKLTSLPKDIQAIFSACVYQESIKFTSEFNARNGASLQTLIGTHNVQLRRFPNDFLQAYGTACGEVIQELRDGGDAVTKEVIESFLKARREQSSWNRIAEQGFLNARLLDYKFPS